MSDVAFTAKRFIRETMIDRGMKMSDARRFVAGEIGVAPGALQRLCDGTLVHIERLTERLNAYAVRRLERKIAALSHELEVARLAAARPDEPDIMRAFAALEEAKRALGK